MSSQPVADGDLDHPPASGAEPDPAAGLLSAREAAAALGLDERTIRRAIQRGELVATKHGRSFRISRAALARYRPRARPLARAATGRTWSTRKAAERAHRRTRRRSRSRCPVATGPPLPRPLTPFVGREREVAALAALLRGDDVRLVTLTGPGGVGKTRLALAVAHELARRVRRRRRLRAAGRRARSPGAQPALVLAAIAQALGVRGAGATAARCDLGCRPSSATAQLLLVLDNFEHVAAAAPPLAELLAACPGVTVLVTSRALLRLSGEHELAGPAAGPARLVAGDRAPRSTGAGRPGRAEAVRLFVERARAVSAGLRADRRRTRRPWRRSAARLDGLPLAIELAAARCARPAAGGAAGRLDAAACRC